MGQLHQSRRFPSDHRDSNSWATFPFGCAVVRFAAIVILFSSLPPCNGTLRDLGYLTDNILESDVGVGGGCEDGCVREVISGLAVSVGEVDCDLHTQNLLDHTKEDVSGGALSVVHWCTNADGDLLYEGSAPCLYSVCVTAEWTGAQVSYSVVVEHEPSDEAHAVHFQVYINEYDDLWHVPEVSFETLGSTTESAAPRCTLGSTCEAASECVSGYTETEIITEDGYGDGWVGAIPDRINTWSVTEGASDDVAGSVVAEGALGDFHLSGTTPLCLEDGEYTFSTTADAAWSGESTWTVCGMTGGLGGSLQFEVSDGECSVLDDSNASGPEMSSAETSYDDLCSMPEDSPCVGLSVGVAEPSGPSIGMYYDETCLEGGNGVTGCNGGGVQGCRMCFVNRDFWLADYPNKRYPDWIDCPCCVASSLGVSCQGGFTGTAVQEATFVEEAMDYYWEGNFAMLAGMSALIGIGVIVACHCCLSIRRYNQKMISMKHYRARGYKNKVHDNYGDTSSNATPPLHGSSGSGGSSNEFRGQGRPRKNTAELDDAEGSPDAAGADAPYPATSGTAAPSNQKAAAPAGHLRLPGASRTQHPSDASWNSSKLGISVSGNKNPRWSGSRELKAYLRRTGFESMDDEEDQQSKGGGSRIKKGKKGEFDWVDGPQPCRVRHKTTRHDGDSVDEGGNYRKNDRRPQGRGRAAEPRAREKSKPSGSQPRRGKSRRRGGGEESDSTASGGTSSPRRRVKPVDHSEDEDPVDVAPESFMDNWAVGTSSPALENGRADRSAPAGRSKTNNSSSNSSRRRETDRRPEARARGKQEDRRPGRTKQRQAPEDDEEQRRGSARSEKRERRRSSQRGRSRSPGREWEPDLYGDQERDERSRGAVGSNYDEDTTANHQRSRRGPGGGGGGGGGHDTDDRGTRSSSRRDRGGRLKEEAEAEAQSRRRRSREEQQQEKKRPSQRNQNHDDGRGRSSREPSRRSQEEKERSREQRRSSSRDHRQGAGSAERETEAERRRRRAREEEAEEDYHRHPRSNGKSRDEQRRSPSRDRRHGDGGGQESKSRSRSSGPRDEVRRGNGGRAPTSRRR